MDAYKAIQKTFAGILVRPGLVAVWTVVSVLPVLLVLGVSLDVATIKEKLEDRIEGYKPVFNQHDFPSNCDALEFPSFHDVVPGFKIDVKDKSIDDWKKLLREGKLSNEQIPCGNMVDPHRARVIDLDDAQEAVSRAVDLGFSLQFAQDTKDDFLYIIGKATHSNRYPPPDRFSLTLHYADFVQKTFRFQLDNGQSTMTPLVLSAGMNSQESNRDGGKDNDSITLPEGSTWDIWDTKNDKKSIRYFEIQIAGREDIDAVEVTADLLRWSDKNPEDPPYASKIGTRGPVPLHGEINVYQITGHLSQNIHHEFYFAGVTNSQVPLSSMDPIIENSRSVPWSQDEAISRFLAQMLGAVYKSYYSIMNLDLCSPTLNSLEDTEAERMCIFIAESHRAFPYHLRIGAVLEEEMPGKEKRILFMKTPLRPLPPVWYIISSILITAFSALALTWLSKMYKEQVARGRIIEGMTDKLNEKNHDLTRAKEKLEERTMLLSTACEYILHEAHNDLLRLRNMDGLPETEKNRVREHAQSLEVHLRDSTKHLMLKENVEKEVKKYKNEEPFFLIDSLNHLISDINETSPVSIESLDNSHLLRSLRLPATGKEQKDARFAQALRKVLENAIRYRSPDGAVGVKVDTEYTQAVIEISNKGKPLDEDVLKKAFDLGFSKSGKYGSSAVANNPVQPVRKHGYGLFVTKQIVSGLGGSCAIRYDKERLEVIVTIWVPLL